MRSQLGATVKVCQELLARLEKDKKNGGEVEVVAEQHKTKEVCGALAVVIHCEFGVLQASLAPFLGRHICNLSSIIFYRWQSHLT